MRRQPAEHVIDKVRRAERPVAYTFLRRVDCVTHSRPAEAALRLGEPWVGEHRVGLRDSAARVRLHVARPYGPGHRVGH